MNYLHRLYINYIYMTYRGLRNLWRWKLIIWQDAQFDYTFLLIIMIKKFELMEDLFDNHAGAVGSKKLAREIKIARLLLERIYGDNYTHIVFNREDYKHSEYLIKQDIAYFCGIINKRLRTWWD